MSASLHPNPWDSEGLLDPWGESRSVDPMAYTSIGTNGPLRVSFQALGAPSGGATGAVSFPMAPCGREPKLHPHRSLELIRRLLTGHRWHYEPPLDTDFAITFESLQQFY